VRTLLAIGLVVATVSVAWAADRIFTNPKPDAHLKKLFPQAVAFSPLEGAPLHFKAYAVDPKTKPDAQPIGYAFWSTDLVPQERGYHGAIHFLIGLDLTGIITGVVLDYDSEPYGYFSVQPAAFVAQFKGKSVRDPFKLGQDVDMVSRASITMNSAVRAIRDSSRAMARQFLNPASVKQQ
jgi:transcriptional regulator of nitric oxide reductase